MPSMDGITATRAIRRSGGQCAEIPIIALTADASAERRRFYDNAGLTDFMTKPIDANDLAARLAAIAALPTADSSQAVFDDDHLGQLRAALGPKRLRSLLDLLRKEVIERPALIRGHLAAGRLCPATDEAHSLKGAALSIGAGPLSKAAAAIEQLASATDAKINAGLLDDLELAAAKVIAATESLDDSAPIASSAPH